ncbi:MAG: aminotransferase class IV [Pirellulales bacterium]|nr:aminotransferase class IV [Pirellulales bacterium]
MPTSASSRRIVYLSGRFVPEHEARLSIYDSALTTGDMAFEVTRTIGGAPFRLRQHLERLAHTLAQLRIDPWLTLDELEAITLETVARNRRSEAADVDWNIIHNVSRGPAGPFADAFAPDELRPTVVVSCFPLVKKLAALADAYEAGLDLVVPQQRAIPSDLLDATIKTRSRLHYHHAAYQAEDIFPGASAVLVDPDGFLTEGTTGNVFVVRRGVLETPEPRNLLVGVTRGVVLELAAAEGIPAREANLTADDARAADEIFLTSTSIGILHGRTFERQPVGDGRLGPLTARLRAAFYREVGLDFGAQSRTYSERLRHW